MSDYVNFLVWVFYAATGTTVECALKVKRETLPGDCEEYPMEPENRAALHAMLPAHVRSCGPICRVTTLFEIHVAPGVDA